MVSVTFLSKDQLLSEAIPSSDDTTSFLHRLAESLEAVEAALRQASMSNPGYGLQPSTDVQAPACPAQITEDAMLAFPNCIALPAIDEANAPPAVAESYAKLVQRYSESIFSVQSILRSMNRTWDRACALAHKFPLEPSESASPSALAPAGNRSAVQSSGALASSSPAAEADGTAAQATAGPPTKPPLSSTTASPPTPSAAAVREYSRVRIEGLKAKPELNGRAGVVRGAFNEQSGRWTVEVAADEVGPAYVGSFRAANLFVIEVCARDLAESSMSSLKRQDKRFMGEVFSRHAKPLGLSARALVSALHAIDHSAFPAQVSDSDANCKLNEVDTSNKGYANFFEFCQAAKISCDAGTDTSAARDVFLRFVKGLSAQALVAALKEVDAPVLFSSEGCSPEQIFRRADANASGSVDFAELDPALVLVIFRCHSHNFGFRFMRAANLPDDLEMILEEHHLGVRAALL